MNEYKNEAVRIGGQMVMGFTCISCPFACVSETLIQRHVEKHIAARKAAEDLAKKMAAKAVHPNEQA